MFVKHFVKYNSVFQNTWQNVIINPVLVKPTHKIDYLTLKENNGKVFYTILIKI